MGVVFFLIVLVGTPVCVGVWFGVARLACRLLQEGSTAQRIAHVVSIILGVLLAVLIVGVVGFFGYIGVMNLIH
ncbi:MAG: hypothetical protein IJ438_13405 [Clostridia bacterium]|nr:hypothetical protein [Clostridia bacterium]